MKIEGMGLPGGGGPKKEKMSPMEQAELAIKKNKEKREALRKQRSAEKGAETPKEVSKALEKLETAKMGSGEEVYEVGEGELEMFEVDATSPDYVLSAGAEIYKEVLNRTLEKLAARANEENEGLEITPDEMKEVIGSTVKGSIYDSEQASRAGNDWKKKKGKESFNGEEMEDIANYMTDGYWKKPLFQKALKNKVDEKLNPQEIQRY